MTKSTMTRERIEQYANDPRMCNVNDEIREMARMALAAMDSDPVVYMWDSKRNDIDVPGFYFPEHLFFAESNVKQWGGEIIPLYRHAQQPVVPDESYQQLSELYHAQEKRLFKIAQRIKGPAFDKYAHPTSRAIDVLEVAIFGEDEACRAATLQAGNSQLIPEGYVMVPAKLTAENGAKSALLGEFNLENTLTCHECFGEGCEDCNDEGRWINSIPVDWTTIKAIWSKAVEHFVATQQEEKSE
ncbi:hypothetical protein [Klebsiella michiganensis]|uniref:hypothetical protein n=1 Tax=Klebsiella michiganensis TaxID=1134687 RepID=UPI00375E3363